MFGELVPLGGGDPIPLLKRQLLVGRRESCDIVLRFANVSAHHCQLTINGGYWYVKDLGSKNGLKINGSRYTERRLDPGDTISLAKHTYEIQYAPMDIGAVGPPPAQSNVSGDIMSKSLLERAGLSKRGAEFSEDSHRRYNVMNNDAGQIKNPNKPL